MAERAPCSRKRVTIVHAFSRKNAGDGLLVDLTFEALGEAGVAPENCRLVALDPASFPEARDVVRAPGEPTARLTGKLAGAVGELLLSGANMGRMAKLLRQTDMVVAVGGGYLVADSPVRQAGVALNHLAQLRAAARHRGPSVYLPQSIGPLQGPVGMLTRRALAGIDRIWARDDRTVAELGLPNVRRCPDLAVMKLARGGELSLASSAGEGVLLVGRDLPRAGGFAEKLLVLGDLLPDARWAVQADMTGPRSDRSFYRRIGIEDHGALEALLKSPSGPVVSVRLHGAIAALLAGRPAIHLAYERKGWGAYQDLGLDEFVHDARTFDPGVVAAQARALAADPASFWARVEAAKRRLEGAWREMIGDIASRLNV
jgi:polysaccharide pyruvyl transferase WcaK-like protein